MAKIRIIMEKSMIFNRKIVSLSANTNNNNNNGEYEEQARINVGLLIDKHSV